jgi:hypothetical protein
MNQDHCKINVNDNSNAGIDLMMNQPNNQSHFALAMGDNYCTADLNFTSPIMINPNNPIKDPSKIT